VQRIHAHAAVIGEGREAGEIRGLASLEIGIVRERIPDLLGLGEFQLLSTDA
jgi:hypothetical protein